MVPFLKLDNSDSYFRSKRRLSAFALVSVLVLVAILSLVSLEFARRSGIHLKMTVNYAQSVKALYGAHGGYQAALALLMGDKNEYDGAGDMWYGELPPVFLGEGSVVVSIEDEQARFNLARLVTEYGLADKRRSAMCSRLFEMLSIDPLLADSIVDWEDSDDEALPYGAESAFYSRLDPAYRPRNRQMLTNGELLVMKGFDRELYFLPPAMRSPAAKEEMGALLRYITVYGDGRININTAETSVLACLSSDMDEFVARDIVEYREEHPFKAVDELKQVKTVSDVLFDEISSLITVRSDMFRIRSRGMVGEATREITAVVSRAGGGIRVAYFERSL